MKTAVKCGTCEGAGVVCHEHGALPDCPRGCQSFGEQCEGCDGTRIFFECDVCGLDCGLPDECQAVQA